MDIESLGLGILVLLYYIVMSYSLSVIATKCGYEKYRFVAWVPIPLVRVILLCKITDVSYLWLLSILVPGGAVVLIMWLWMNIIEMFTGSQKKGVVGGLLVGWPGINVIPAAYIAFK